MALRLLSTVCALALYGAALAGCVHVPKGQSLSVALAKKAELVRMPATPTPSTAVAHQSSSAAPDKTELVADAYSRGEFCMKAGATAEAISAFQEVVKLDPKFSQAWNNLAALYEAEGNEAEAMKAFKRSKNQ